ncbi:MAG: DUF302 domain-containing protein [Bacteroidales bacterium]|nr:DUF302 domain-containing protein [Bacteroidales bacterium]
MNKIGTLLIGLVAGILISFALLYIQAPSLMIMEDESKYNFEETVARFEEAAQNQGWKISKTHDLQASLAKFGTEVQAIKVIELCHPEYAGEILSNVDARVVASMMPCRVAIYEKNGKVILSRMNSSLMAKSFGGIITKVMANASADNEIMINSLKLN